MTVNNMLHKIAKDTLLRCDIDSVPGHCDRFANPLSFLTLSVVFTSLFVRLSYSPDLRTTAVNNTTKIITTEGKVNTNGGRESKIIHE